MAAAMAGSAGDEFALFRDVRRLAEAGQGVEFAQNGDHRPVLARLAHHGGRQAGEAGRHLEAARGKHRRVGGGGALFLEIEFGRLPHRVAEAEKGVAVLFDQRPGVVEIARHRLSPPYASAARAVALDQLTQIKTYVRWYYFAAATIAPAPRARKPC